MPSICELSAKTDSQLERWLDTNCVFYIERAFQGPPSERGETRRIRVSAHLALQKALQIAERRLAVLVLD